MSLGSNLSLGTFGGTFLTIVGVIDLGDIVKTIILASIGAIVSYIISRLMKSIFERTNPNQ